MMDWTTNSVEAFDGTTNLGSDRSISSRTFTGLMDDFRIYKRTLNAAEIGDLYTAGVPTNNPPVANDATFAVAEDSAVGTSVGTVIASGPDAGDTLGYAITGGNTRGAFSIDSSGNITTATALDYETISSYHLAVTVSGSGSLSDTATVTVKVTDVLEVTAPTVAPGGSSNITQTGADIGFTVSDDGRGAPTVTIYWGESAGGNTHRNWINSSSAGIRSVGSPAASITGLTEGTRYYYMVRAVNSSGESWGTPADSPPSRLATPSLKSVEMIFILLQ